jgi:hypothetical protein
MRDPRLSRLAGVQPARSANGCSGVVMIRPCAVVRTTSRVVVRWIVARTTCDVSGSEWDHPPSPGLGSGAHPCTSTQSTKRGSAQRLALSETATQK